MMDMKSLRRILILLLLICVLPQAAQACPGCKQALATADGEQANMVNGYFWSILFMLSMPFTLLGAFCGSMYLAVRKARKRLEGNNAQPEASIDEFAASGLSANDQ